MKTQRYIRNVAVTGLMLALATANAQLYINNDAAGTGINEYNASTGATIRSPLVSAVEPGPMALDGSGDMFAIYFNGGNIGVGEFNASTEAAIQPLLIINVGDSADYLALDRNGHLFVSFRAGKVAEYTTSGMLLNANFVTGLNSDAEGLAVDGSGHLFVASRGKVGEYNISDGSAVNGSLITISSTFGPYGIALDGKGGLYAAYTGFNNNGKVGEYNAATGAAINASLINGLNFPDGIALDGSGDLFVATSANAAAGAAKVGEYNATTGAALNASFVTGLTADSFQQLGVALATPVPESSTWLTSGLMLLPLGAAALRALRKPRTA